MRDTTTCPKCKGRRIWRIEQVHTEGEALGGKPLRMLVEREMPRRDGTTGFFGGATEYVSVGLFDLFVCARCGFAEWYAHHFEDLFPSPEHGVHLLDGEAPGAPYR